MRRSLQIIALTTVLAASSVAAHALDAGKVEAVAKAADAFAALAADSHTTGRPPRRHFRSDEARHRPSRLPDREAACGRAPLTPALATGHAAIAATQIHNILPPNFR